MRILTAAALMLLALGCRQPRHPHPELTVEEPEPLRDSIDVLNPADEGQLLDGFYSREPAGWRWSAPQFTITLGVPETLRGRDARIEFEMVIPEAGAADLAGLTITAKSGDHELGQWKAPGAGTHTAVFPVPAALLGEEGIVVDFALDRFIAPRGGESRRLGVIPAKFRLAAAGR
ncbi:MAG: hypothetical protein ACOYX1_05815 [Acidobacteriota bacterium]